MQTKRPPAVKLSYLPTGESPRRPARPSPATASLLAESLDFRGLGPNIFSILRGGIPGHREFPRSSDSEMLSVRILSLRIEREQLLLSLSLSLLFFFFFFLYSRPPPPRHPADHRLHARRPRPRRLGRLGRLGRRGRLDLPASRLLSLIQPTSVHTDVSLSLSLYIIYIYI